MSLSAFVRLPPSSARPTNRAPEKAALLPLEEALTRLKNAWRPEDHARVLAELVDAADGYESLLPQLLERADHPLIAPGLELAGAAKVEATLPQVFRLAERRDLRIRALTAADTIAPLSEEELVALLEDPEPAMVLAALAMARRRENPPLRALVNLLTHAQRRVADTALAALPRKLPALLRHELEMLTRDDRQEVRTRAWQALLRLEQAAAADDPVRVPEEQPPVAEPGSGTSSGDASAGATDARPADTPEAHAALLEQLDSPDEKVRLVAVRSLAVLARPEDSERMVAILRSPNPAAVQKAACLFLGRVQCRPAVRDLIDVLRDSTDVGLKENAHWSLQRITGLTLKQDAELWEAWWQRVGHDHVAPNTR